MSICTARLPETRIQNVFMRFRESLNVVVFARREALWLAESDLSERPHLLKILSA